MPARTTILGTQPPVDRAIVIGNPKPEMPSSGWDVLKETLWLPHPYFIRRGDVRDGPPPESGYFIVQDFNITDWRAGCPIVEVISLGIAQRDGKDFKLECTGGISEDLGLASLTTTTIWRTGYTRVTKQWVSLTTPRVQDHVNVASVPPDTFGLPATAWGIAFVAADNWAASGWIGENRSTQQLPGSQAGLTTDTWLYDPGYGDRDGVAPGVIYL